MEITSEGICLRPWKLSDARRLAAIANNKKIADNLRDGFPNPYLLQDARSWLQMIMPENRPPRYFAVLLDGDITGSIGIVNKCDIYRLNCEVGYFIDEKHWGKGIATRAIRAATGYAFDSFDIVRVYAEPFADNKGSRKALEKAGFTLEAMMKRNVVKNNIVKDSCIYSVLKEEWRNFPFRITF